MSNLLKIHVYQATKLEADEKKPDIYVLTDLRQENNYRLLIANLLKLKPALVIQMNPVGEFD